MAPKILVVDRNEAFAAMLEDMLTTDGGYQVEVVHNGQDALAALNQNGFDLTIVDMDLGSSGMDYQELIQGVRQSQPAMRLMLIPLMGEDLPPEASQLNIQGTLAKPFFADDLLPNIEDALTKDVRAPSQSAPVAPAASAPVTEARPEVGAVLNELAREVTADSVILLSGESGSIIAHASTLREDTVKTLASLSVETVRAAQATAQLLGQPDAPFEHNMFENNSLRLYIMALLENLLLVIVAPVSTPLGTIRHNSRRAARDLAGVALT
jgi:CheY-like chemotaxis protein